MACFFQSFADFNKLSSQVFQDETRSRHAELLSLFPSQDALDKKLTLITGDSLFTTTTSVICAKYSPCVRTY